VACRSHVNRLRAVVFVNRSSSSGRGLVAVSNVIKRSMEGRTPT
jgi:hypothetical protein